MKTIVPAILLSVLSCNVMADNNQSNKENDDDNVIQHKFKTGDTISADVFNEIVDSLNTTLRGFNSPDDLVGAWNCTYSYQTYAVEEYCSSSEKSYFTKDPTNMFYTNTQSIVFKSVGDGTYSINTEHNALMCNSQDWNTPQVGNYAVVNGHLVSNVLFQKVEDQRISFTHKTHRVSQNKFELQYFNGGSILGTSCVKSSTIPEVPGTLSVVKKNSSITLTWENTGTKKTSYVIMKRAARRNNYENYFSVIGDWSEVTEVSSDTTTYTEDLSKDSAGEYWYRVFAKNSKGLSQGSNIPPSVQYMSKTECSYLKSQVTGYITPPVCSSTYPELYQ